MSDSAPAPLGDERFQSNIDHLSTAIEERPPLEVEEVPATRSSRQLYWAIGVFCALTVGAAEVGILMRGPVSDLPAPPPEVMAQLKEEPCAEQMIKIMNAVSTYTAEHGMPPKTLAELQPGYLDFAPVDPLSHQPYGYQVVGDSVSLTCPTTANPAGAAPSGA